MTSFARFWRTDRGLTALLIFLVIGLLVLPPLITGGLLSGLFVEISFSLILISGVATVSARKWHTIIAACLVAIALAVRWIRVGTESPALHVLDAGLAVATLLILAGLVLYHVLRKGPINLHRVQGSLAAYLLLGLAWSSAYEFIYLLRPESFRFSEASPDRLALLYYSFVTLTTVGYGDIVPVAPVARSLAMAEALVGQLFPAVLIARLVSMELVARTQVRERD